ncbi:MAG: Holliday junction branch migration protein RuvA [Bacteroidales bacterium]|jgi:Holliday junction DNA helicase RuvA|nr:Holliday junction branch migration protein RuvA [Bacteroidales bacterium]NLK80587.1 Holliday junction branch migration protein RuvA [Bacteroidales bacterium]HPY82294.1 Holliday junction branch migration protein RuvA [Bacteroidales bacterium]
MLEFISGTVKTLTPTYVIIETNGLGYFVNISLITCEKLKLNTSTTMLLHEVIREDTFDLYGFLHEEERKMFRLLISVSGIGANTARVILSKLQTSELAQAIIAGDVALIQSVKGIGAKTAQRVIIDLKDKVSRDGVNTDLFVTQSNSLFDEALSALIMLGFSKKSVEKQLQKIIKEEAVSSVEEIVKIALKRL